MNNPEISVIMPVYNGEKYLIEAIDSILNQTYINFEFIILNDGSIDRTEEIILSYDDSRIVYVKNEENLQIVKTLNIGITLAKGKYIARMDADDISYPERLKKQYEFLEEHSNVSVLGTERVVINEWGKVQLSANIVPLTPKICEWTILFYSPTIHPSTMMRKEDILDIGGYCAKKEVEYVEDLKLWVDLIEKGYKIMNLSEPLIKYRVHSTSTTEKYQYTQFKNKHICIQKYIENSYGVILNNYAENMLENKQKHNIKLISAYNFIFDRIILGANPKETRLLKSMHADTVIRLLFAYRKVNPVLPIYYILKESLKHPFVLRRLPKNFNMYIKSRKLVTAPLISIWNK